MQSKTRCKEDHYLKFMERFQQKHLGYSVGVSSDCRLLLSRDGFNDTSGHLTTRLIAGAYVQVFTQPVVLHSSTLNLLCGPLGLNGLLPLVH